MQFSAALYICRRGYYLSHDNMRKNILSLKLALLELKKFCLYICVHKCMRGWSCLYWHSLRAYQFLTCKVSSLILCIIYHRWTWPARVESSPDWGLWEVCQGQDQDFNSSLYMNNISVSSDLWGQHTWNISEDTWRGESRVNPSNMRTSGCASSSQLSVVSSFVC